ncbi:MAG: competence protein ComJ [Beijerinckiaceae bacterium]
MTVTSTQLFVTHGQVAVFDSALEQPFNDWDDAHFKQGFSWRPGSVSFLTLDEGGKFTVEIAIAESIGISPEAIRVIETPFEVPASGSIEIASISGSVPLTVPPGMYSLRYECFPISDDSEGKVRFVFTRTDSPSFKILRADAAITAGEHLLTSASPA